MRAQVHVYTFRDGLLARLAHDLRLTVGAFELQLARDRLQGWFDPSSLTVDGVARGERVDAAALSADDKRRIQENIAREVLETARYPRMELEGRVERDGDGFVFAGRLRLHGREQALRIPLRLGPDGMRAEVELIPSRFGIAPYKALGGAIRLQDRVRVVLEVVAEPDKLIAASASEPGTVFRPG